MTERVFTSNPLFPLVLHPSMFLSIFLLVQKDFVQSHSKQDNSSKCASPFLASILCTKLTFEEHSGQLSTVSIMSLKILVSNNKQLHNIDKLSGGDCVLISSASF